MGKELGVTVRKASNLSDWYTEVIQKSGMIDYSAVSGCMVLKPYSYKVWELITSFLDGEIKKLGVVNAYFPLFIPESLLVKEAEHLEGFTPEVAWVTHAGNSALGERLAVRPTSETIMYDSYKKWIRSHKDLPLKINQWCNVVRWEFKHPVPFLRTREFLWQEGHTAFATREEAEEEVLTIIKLYKKVYEELLAVPVFEGRKSEREKFAGAEYTLSVEAVLPNGKGIQASTSHFLGQNFSKAFGISFLDKDEEKRYVWQNSWGFTTRSIGIMVLTHGDDKGLVMPPRVAPVQVVIVPVLFSDKPDTNKEVLGACSELKEALKEFRVVVDDDPDKTPGWKYNEWELKGVPVRIEIGPREVESGRAVLVARDNGEKKNSHFKNVEKAVSELLNKVQKRLLLNARRKAESLIDKPSTFKGVEEAIKKGKVCLVNWCGSDECEERVRELGAKTLNSPFNGEPSGDCVACSSKASQLMLIGKSY